MPYGDRRRPTGRFRYKNGWITLKKCRWPRRQRRAFAMAGNPDLPARFAAHWERLSDLAPGARLAVAISGGSDSVALLLLLWRLAQRRGLRLAVAHFHHGLRPEADADARMVGNLAARLGLPFWMCRSQRLSPGMPNLEAQARRLRYRFFHCLLSVNLRGSQATRPGALLPLAAAVATGHTLNDQAETVLMRLLRGSGTLGLSGIWPVVRAGHGQILRPLLPFTRAELQSWLRGQGQPWREDATNLDLRHRRNRLRHQLVPRLEVEYNPAIQRRLARLAEILQAEEQAWAGLMAEDVQLLAPVGTSLWPRRAPAASLAALPLARLRRLLRTLAARPGSPPPDSAHVEQITTAIQAAARPAAPTRARQFRLGGKLFRITPRWVSVQPLPPPALY